MPSTQDQPHDVAQQRLPLRRGRSRFAAVLALVLLVVLTGLLWREIGGGFLSTTSAKRGTGTPVEVQAAIASARKSGTITGTVQWVKTTTAAASAITGIQNPDHAGQQMYVVQMRGQFGSSPASAPRRDNVFLAFLIIAPNGTGDHGTNVSEKIENLSALGPVHTLTLPSGAARSATPEPIRNGAAPAANR